MDIIISEWMGYFLLYESMLDTVLFARDKWLKVSEESFLFPNKARIMVAGIEDGKFKEEKLEFWHNVYGFNMSCMRDDAILEPLVDYVDSDQIVTTSAPIVEIDLKNI